jgi:hypothetical protein
MCNLDAYIYLVYLRNVAKFFGLLSIFSITILLPLFLTEEKSPKSSSYSLLTRASMINIMSDRTRIWVVYLFSFGYSIGGLGFIYFLCVKMTKKTQSSKLGESELAERSLMITGIPTSIHVTQCNIMLYEIFNERFRG